MPINVYAWPPVGAIGSEWTVDAPVARLRSALTGRDQMQSSQRVRRLATVQVSALAAGSMGAGYSEMLKQLLAGGVHGVRLKSSPINWYLDQLQRETALNSTPLYWRTGSDPLAWQTGGQPLLWYRGGSGGNIATGIPGTSGGWNTLLVSGLPARRLVARPGDYIRCYEPDDPDVWQIARVVRPATTNAAGSVTVRLDRPVTISPCRVNMAGQDEAVFRVEGDLPRAVQPVSGDWSYTWNFREVFADEVGGFAEVDPWT